VAHAIGPDALQATLGILSQSAFPQGSPLQIFSLLAIRDYATAVPILDGSVMPSVEPQSPHSQATPCLTTAPSLSGAHSPTSHRSASPSHHSGRHGQPFGRSALTHARPPFVPAVAPDGTPLRPAWHSTLLMLAAHRSAADAPAVGALGDRLWGDNVESHGFALTSVGKPVVTSHLADHDRVAAHICYVLAGRAVESPFAPDSHFVLPGADHQRSPRAFLSPEAVQRGELHAWCLQQSMGIPMYTIAPYYLMVCSYALS
jgi:hypothetical protein